jgi:hypothetical protein
MGIIKLLHKARINRRKQKEEKPKKIPSVQSPGGTWFDAKNLDENVTDSDINKSTRSIESGVTLNTSYSDSSSIDTSERGWTSSGEKNHHKGSPLIARPHCNNDSFSKSTRNIIYKSSRSIKIEDETAELGLVMARSRQLPKHSWYYTNNHIQVNNERTKRTIAPLLRKPILDEAAREHARTMAQRADGEQQNIDGEEHQEEVTSFHSDPWDLRSKLIHRERKQQELQLQEQEGEEDEEYERMPSHVPNNFHHFHRIGENVAVGNTIQEIHMAMMSDSIADRNNILDRRYVYFGMGTAKSQRSGKIYVCQIFQG